MFPTLEANVAFTKLAFAISGTRWLDYFSTFGHLHQQKFAKVGQKFCQIVNKPSKNCPRLGGFCQSDEISTKMVTVFAIW